MYAPLWRTRFVLRLPCSAYDGKAVRLQQSKTGRRVVIPAGEPLRSLLGRTQRQGPLILTTSGGKPWTSDGFRSSWRKACDRVGIEGLTFHDLRGSAVVRLALADATVPQIASFTGHSLRDVEAILCGSLFLASNRLLCGPTRRTFFCRVTRSWIRCTAEALTIPYHYIGESERAGTDAEPSNPHGVLARNKYTTVKYRMK